MQYLVQLQILTTSTKASFYLQAETFLADDCCIVLHWLKVWNSYNSLSFVLYYTGVHVLLPSKHAVIMIVVLTDLGLMQILTDNSNHDRILLHNCLEWQLQQ